MSESILHTIELTQGQTALVDERDWHDLKQFKWHAYWSVNTKSFYAVRTIREDGTKSTERMHRRIMRLGIGDRRQVDHQDHDTLDNRRSNLRIVTNRENHENLRNQSPYGVSVRTTRQTFSTATEC